MRPNRFAGCPQTVMGMPASPAPRRPSSSCALLRSTSPATPRWLGGPPPSRLSTVPLAMLRPVPGGRNDPGPVPLAGKRCMSLSGWTGWYARQPRGRSRIALAPPDHSGGRLNERRWVGPDLLLAGCPAQLAPVVWGFSSRAEQPRSSTRWVTDTCPRLSYPAR